MLQWNEQYSVLVTAKAFPRSLCSVHVAQFVTLRPPSVAALYTPAKIRKCMSVSKPCRHHTHGLPPVWRHSGAEHPQQPYSKAAAAAAAGIPCSRSRSDALIPPHWCGLGLPSDRGYLGKATSHMMNSMLRSAIAHARQPSLVVGNAFTCAFEAEGNIGAHAATVSSLQEAGVLMHSQV